MREIPGSSLEGDDARTWDESVAARPPWEEDELDWTYDEDQPGSYEAARREEWIRRHRLEAEVALIKGRLAGRPAPASDALSFDPDEERLLQIEDELETLDEPPPDWVATDAMPETPTPVDACTPFGTALASRLSDGELRHWRWIEQGRLQSDIASELGISQSAVAQREHKLRARVDAIHRETTGRPYPWPGGPGRARRLGARGTAIKSGVVPRSK